MLTGKNDTAGHKKTPEGENFKKEKRLGSSEMDKRFGDPGWIEQIVLQKILPCGITSKKLQTYSQVNQRGSPQSLFGTA